jgi:hypothetical protein
LGFVTSDTFRHQILYLLILNRQQKCPPFQQYPSKSQDLKMGYIFKS